MIDCSAYAFNQTFPQIVANCTNQFLARIPNDVSTIVSDTLSCNMHLWYVAPGAVMVGGGIYALCKAKTPQAKDYAYAALACATLTLGVGFAVVFAENLKCYSEFFSGRRFEPMLPKIQDYSNQVRNDYVGCVTENTKNFIMKNRCQDWARLGKCYLA